MPRPSASSTGCSSTASRWTRCATTTTFDGQTFDKGSYVVWMDQAHRGLADTALNAGVDISDRISILYAPPAAWSHGYLWGADVAEIPDGADFSPVTNRDQQDDDARRRRRARSRRGIRARARLGHGRADAERARRRRAHRQDGAGGVPGATGGTLPAGTVLFAADHATRVKLATAGRDNGLLFRRIVSEDFPSSTDPIDRVAADPRAHRRGEPGRLVAPEPRVPGGLHDDGHAQLGPHGSAGELRRHLEHRQLARDDPATARARLTAFFAAGGGYMGRAQVGRTSSPPAPRYRPDRRHERRRPGAAASSAGSTRAPPARSPARTGRGQGDRRPAELVHGGARTYSVDARLPLTNFFLAGMWQNAESTTAPGSPFVAHGMSTAGTRGRELRDEPALPGGSGARVADGRRGRLLGDQSASQERTQREGRGNPPLAHFSAFRAYGPNGQARIRFRLGEGRYSTGLRPGKSLTMPGP